MAWSLRATGTGQRQYNAALTPSAPSATVAGDLLVFQAMMNIGNIAASTLTVSGWTLVGPPSGDTTTKCLGLWLRIATLTDPVSCNWGTINTDAYGWITAYNPGGTCPPLASIVHACVGLGAPQNSDVNETYPNLTVTQPGCLILLAGTRNNVTASQSSTWNGVSGNGTFVIDQSVVLANFSPDMSAVLNRQIQTTATSIASAAQTLTGSESPNQSYSSISLALLPNASTPPAVGNSGSMGVMQLAGTALISLPGYSGSSGSANVTKPQSFSTGGGSVGVMNLIGTSAVLAQANVIGVGSGSYGVASLQLTSYPRLIIDIASVPYWQFLDSAGNFFYVPAGLTNKATPISIGQSPFSWVNPTGNFANVIIDGGVIQAAYLLGVVPANSGPYTFVSAPTGAFQVSLQSNVATEVTVPPGATLVVAYTQPPQMWYLNSVATASLGSGFQFGISQFGEGGF